MRRKVMFVLLVLLMCAKDTFQQNVSVGANWTTHPDLRTGRMTLISSSSFSSCSDNVTTPPSYNISYSKALTSIKSAGIGIVGFNTSISLDFKINVTADYITNSTMRVTMRTFGDTVLCMLAINWIVVGNGFYFADIQLSCYLCSRLNVGSGPRSQTFNGVTSFVGIAVLDVRVYLSGFWLTNHMGLNDYLRVNASIVNGSNIINYVFSTNENNTVSSICYTTIVYCDICTKPFHRDYVYTGSNSLSKDTNVGGNLNFPFWHFPANWKHNNGMFYGMGEFTLSRATFRLFYMSTEPNSVGTEFTTNYGTYEVIINFFWQTRWSCNQTFQWFDNETKTCNLNCSVVNKYNYSQFSICTGCYYTCLTCNDGGENNCQTCNNTLNRVNDSHCSCRAGFIDIGDIDNPIKLCYPCSTFIVGCQYCQSQIKCMTCYPNFILQQNLCYCQTGHLVSSICTNITGCTQLSSLSGYIFCTQCDTSLFFQLNSNYTCSCSSGYYFDGSTICYSLCGDGLQTPDQVCDHGNKMNGDGCSSVCMIEDNWMCINGSITFASICYIDYIFQLKILYVRRITTSNQMQVDFQLNPNIPQLSLINFKKYVQTNVPCSDFSVLFDDGIVKVIFDYNQTIQGNKYNFSVTLDPNYFHQAVISTVIDASGMNGKLTDDNFNNFNYPLVIVVIILDCIAILIAVLSCLSQRMIGVEMLQTIQTVLFTQSVMKTTPSSFTPLQMLRYASGYNELGGIDYGRTYPFAFSLSSIGLQKQFILSYNLMYLILVLIIILCLIMKLKQLYHQKKLQNIDDTTYEKHKVKLECITKYYNFVFERIVFIGVFVCMFLIIFALMLQLTDMNSRYCLLSVQFNLLGTMIGISILTTMICVVIINGLFPGTLLFPMLMKQYYPPIYFIYQSTFIFLLAFNYRWQNILYILEGLSLVFLVFNIVYHPYPQKFHNFVLAFHQLLIMGVMGVWIFQNNTTPNQHEVMYKIINGFIILLLYVVVGLNIYRLWHYSIFLKSHRWDQYGNPKNIDQFKNSSLMDYANLHTPTQIKQSKKFQDEENNFVHEKQTNKKIKNSINQMKIKYKSKKQRMPATERDMMKWNYNEMAEIEKSNKDILPEHQQLDNTKLTLIKPLSVNSEDEQTVLDDDKSKTNNNKISVQLPTFTLTPKPNSNAHDPDNTNENIFDNPYDDNGFPKGVKNKNNKPQDEDQLQKIKKKYKRNFQEKFKMSTLKEI